MGDQRAQDRQAGFSPAQQSGGRAADAAEIAFTLQIENWWSIKAAYGRGVLDHALGHVFAQLGELVGESVAAATLGYRVADDGPWFDVRLPKRDGYRGRGAQGGQCGLALALSFNASVRPFVYEGQSIHLFLSCQPVRARRVVSEPSSGAAALSTDAAASIHLKATPDVQERPDAGWCRRYRSDMIEAGSLLQAIANDGLCLAWQAVRSASDSSEILYYEGLLRKADAASAGDDVAPLGAIRALERLGLIRLLDQHVVSRIIDQLEADPTVVLAANISALSAIFDQWWVAIESRLLGRRDVARRLVFEITETARISVSQATIFSDRMRRLGCLIALDDFGVGCASIGRLVALSPDIAKVDGSFVRRTAQSERDRRILANIIGLAREISPVVVVEGIETDAQRKLVASIGAGWIQGHFVGRPTVVRPWLFQNRPAEGLKRFQEATAAHFDRSAA